MDYPKHESHLSYSASKPDLNLSIHPAPQQSGDCHSYLSSLNELCRGSVYVTKQDFYGNYYGGFHQHDGFPLNLLFERTVPIRDIYLFVF